MITNLVTVEERATLALMAAEAVAPIVELGSYQGGSTRALALATAQQVYAIDLWDMRMPQEGKGHRNKKKRAVPFESTEAFETFLEHAGNLNNVVWLKGDSLEFAKIWSQWISGLFLDADHSSTATRANFKAWAPHVRPSGWVAFHDCQGFGVAKVIEEVIDDDWEHVTTVGSLYVARKVRV